MAGEEAGAESEAERGPAVRRRPLVSFARDVIVILVVAVLASFLIKTFLFQSFYIPSGSMEHTLEINDRVIVNQLVPTIVPLQRGDVVVFKDPGGWLEGGPQPRQLNPVEHVLAFLGVLPAAENDNLIKRVIGLPGDEVVCCNDFGQMSVNGVALDEPYVNRENGQDAASIDAFSVTVPEDSIWVMGDNRGNSRDSRYNQDTPSKGFVPMSDVVGRAFVLSWPLSRLGWLSNYPGTFFETAT